MLSLDNAKGHLFHVIDDIPLKAQSTFGPIKNWLEGFLSGATDILEEQAFQNAQNFINARKNINGERECRVVLNGQALLVRECNVTHHQLITNDEIYPDIFFQNIETGESESIKGMSFSSLQEKMLHLYLTEQHRYGITNPDLQIVNLPKANVQMPAMHFADFSSTKKAISQLHGYSGKLIISGRGFMVDWKSDHDVKVRPDNVIQIYAAYQLQQRLSRMAEKERAITNMTLDDLPPPLQRLSSEHWEKMGRAVLKNANNTVAVPFEVILEKQFYSDIYSTASSSHFNFSFSNFSHSSPEVRQEEWHSLIMQVQENPNWKPKDIRYAEGARVQGQVDTPENIQQARIFLNYYKAPVRSRIQFVTDYAGRNLLEDIARVIDRFIDAECNHDPALSPVKRFKIFSDDAHVGRSDSAVLYLSDLLADPMVQKLVAYLDTAMGHQMVSIDIIGARNIGTTKIQGINIPNAKLQKKLTGRESNSHGLLVSDVLASAYKIAYAEAIQIHKSGEQIDLNQFNQRAQFHVAKIWHQLGLS